MAVKYHQGDTMETGVGVLGGDDSGIPAPTESVVNEGAEVPADRDEEIKQLQDRLLRQAAEMENTRKRLERDKADAISFANECLVRELLPVIDNLERALQHGEGDSNGKGLLDGLRMTLKSFGDVLGKFGCTSFETVGKAFDPNFHEAVMQQESSEHPEKTVLQELQKGYTLRDRLVRPAMVIVSKARHDPSAAGE
jgi:molecular chaperone GrpE